MIDEEEIRQAAQSAIDSERSMKAAYRASSDTRGAVVPIYNALAAELEDIVRNSTILLVDDVSVVYVAPDDKKLDTLVGNVVTDDNRIASPLQVVTFRIGKAAKTGRILGA